MQAIRLYISLVPRATKRYEFIILIKGIFSLFISLDRTQARNFQISFCVTYIRYLLRKNE